MLGGGYGWWATGLHPFTWSSYLAILVPVVVVCAAAAHPGAAPSPLVADPSRPATTPPRPAIDREPGGPGTPGGAGRGRAWPWLALGGLALGLEGVGLALGGRSAVVPTLSTVIDHAMAWHGSRFALFGLWLAVGAAAGAGRAGGASRWR